MSTEDVIDALVELARGDANIVDKVSYRDALVILVDLAKAEQRQEFQTAYSDQVRRITH